MIKTKSDPLLLDAQLCFQLYLAAKSVVHLYQPLLAAMDLTYPQYLVMLVLWEKREVSVKELGAALQLDSGTLSPLLKRLEAKSFVQRSRDASDERSVRISLTRAGERLRAQAECVPAALVTCMKASNDEVARIIHDLKRLNLKLTSP